MTQLTHLSGHLSGRDQRHRRAMRVWLLKQRLHRLHLLHLLHEAQLLHLQLLHLQLLRLLQLSENNAGLLAHLPVHDHVVNVGVRVGVRRRYRQRLVAQYSERCAEGPA